MANARTGMPDKVGTEWTPRNAETINKMFETLFGRSKFFGGSNLTDPAGLLALTPQVGDIIYGGQNQQFQLLPIVGTAQRVLTNGGLSGTDPIPKWDQVDLTAGVTGKLPLANLVDASTTQVVLGRNAAGTGVYQEVTFSQFLDWVGSAAQGDLLYRGASGWARLAKSTSSAFLSSGSTPAWANPGVGGSNIIAQNFHAWRATNNLITAINVSVNPVFQQGSISTDNQTDSTYGKLAFSGTAINNGVLVTDGSVTYCRTDYDFDQQWVIFTPTVITNLRMYVGLTTNFSNIYSSTDTPGGAADRIIAIRFTSVGGGNFRGYTWDGTNAQATADIAGGFAANTRYLLRITKVGSTVSFSVDGGAAQTLTSNLPAAGTNYAAFLAMHNSAASSASTGKISRMLLAFGA